MAVEFTIAAAASGSGKTTFTMGLLRALRRRGLRVQPFKCGPDYIDTQFHTIAAGFSSVNLDTWMASADHVREIYSHYSTGADACVTEGAMGLFDGYDRQKGSCAEISRLLDLPVILIINAKSAAYTVAALIHGLKTFDPQVRIAGVVFNQVGSPSHYSFLKDACADAGVEDLGYIPKTPVIEVPSRHLGLSLEVKNEISSLSDRIADLIEEHVKVDRIIELCRRETPKPDGNALRQDSPTVLESGTEPASKLRIAVARDAAFCFSYRENLDRLAQAGEIEFFSPLQGQTIPEETDFLYLPGGYPELFAKELSSNRRLAEDLKEYVEADGRVLAECGGMMYLTQAITAQDGIRYPMAGVLPIECTMDGAHLHLGYRRTEYGGLELRGHEFHYSAITDPSILDSASVQYGAKGQKTDTALFRYRNVIAGYTHWYWGEQDILELWQ